MREKIIVFNSASFSSPSKWISTLFRIIQYIFSPNHHLHHLPNPHLKELFLILQWFEGRGVTVLLLGTLKQKLCCK